MRILVDGYNLGLSKGTGVANYGRGFITAVRRLGHETGVVFGSDGSDGNLRTDRLEQLYNTKLGVSGPWHKAARLLGGIRASFGFSAERLIACEKAAHERSDTRLPPGTELWNAPGLYPYGIAGFRWLGTFSELANPGFDLAHWTFPLPIKLAGAVNIYTIHDLIPVLQPEFTTIAIAPYWRRLQAMAARADHVVTVSESSRQDIITHLGLASDRVTNCGLAHSIEPATLNDLRRSADDTVREEFALEPGEYFLFFGAIEPKKNVARLLEAYFLSGSKRPLVMAGGEGWLVERELAPLAARRGTLAAERVILAGYLPRHHLLALVHSARATLFPSLTEGFGLPAVEAMALGTPVMASRGGGLTDTVGDAALVIDPFDVSDMARAITRLDSDADLRVQLSALGPDQAEQFSPEAYASKIKALLGRL